MRTADCFNYAGEHDWGWGRGRQVWRVRGDDGRTAVTMVGCFGPRLWGFFNFHAICPLSLFVIPKVFLLGAMATARTLRSLMEPRRRIALINGCRSTGHRCMATAAADSPTLPLAGIRVLDMTRVLAGV